MRQLAEQGGGTLETRGVATFCHHGKGALCVRIVVLYWLDVNVGHVRLATTFFHPFPDDISSWNKQNTGEEMFSEDFNILHKQELLTFE